MSSEEKKVLARLKSIAERAQEAGKHAEAEDWTEVLDALSDITADVEVAERAAADLLPDGDDED